MPTSTDAQVMVSPILVGVVPPRKGSPHPQQYSSPSVVIPHAPERADS